MWERDENGNMVWIEQAQPATYTMTTSNTTGIYYIDMYSDGEYDYSTLPLAFDPKPKRKCIFDE